MQAVPKTAVPLNNCCQTQTVLSAYPALAAVLISSPCPADCVIVVSPCVAQLLIPYTVLSDGERVLFAVAE
jgi:hypothetical protein